MTDRRDVLIILNRRDFCTGAGAGPDGRHRADPSVRLHAADDCERQCANYSPSLVLVPFYLGELRHAQVRAMFDKPGTVIIEL